MRTEKELWEVVLSRHDLFELGLCVWLGICYDEGLLSLKEFIFLDKRICNLKTNQDSLWIGPKDELQPRIDWIKKRIETL